MTIARNVINHLILLAGTAFLILPVAAIFLSSTHPTATLASEGLQLSWGGYLLENYRAVILLDAGFSDRVTPLAMLGNSLVVGAGVASLTTLFSLLTAYAIVFFKFRRAGFVFWLVLVTLLFPLESRFISTFKVTADLGLINTRLGIVLPVIAAALGTFFYRQYFKSLPGELIEAATLDGAGPIRFLIDIVIPLSWPATGGIFAIAFMIGWNQYLWPIMISTDDSLYTLVRGIQLVGPISGPGMALAVISIAPPLVLLLAVQRWFFTALKLPVDRNSSSM